jgi:major intracellular serine protease
MKAVRLLSILLVGCVNEVPQPVTPAKIKPIRPVMAPAAPVKIEDGNFTPTETRPIIVAIIDTGINPSLGDKISLCRFGHKDFSGYGLEDHNNHGSHIAGIVDAYAKGIKQSNTETKANYCQVILKFYENGNGDTNDHLVSEREALRYAINLKVDIINMSISGPGADAEEEKLIKEALDKGIKIVVAAGNEGHELDADIPSHTSYPAMYDDSEYVVGNLGKDRKPASSSNYGKAVNIWEFGQEVISFCKDGNLCYMSGTSQAAAIRTGKIIRSMLRQRH